MSKSKYIPRGWEYEGSLVLCSQQEENDFCIAAVHSHGGMTGTGYDYKTIHDPRRIQDVNGRLIAAAPDMLEALELIAPLFEDLSDEWWCPSCGATECSYDYRCTKCGIPIADCQPEPSYGPTIRAAIAKAKGETDAQES